MAAAGIEAPVAFALSHALVPGYNLSSPLHRSGVDTREVSCASGGGGEGEGPSISSVCCHSWC